MLKTNVLWRNIRHSQILLNGLKHLGVVGPCKESVTSIFPGRHLIRQNHDDIGQASQSVTINFMNQENKDLIMIDAYSPLGFRLNNGIRVVGPCAVFPKSVLQWNVSDAMDIDNDALSLFTMFVPKLDILVIGKGEKEAKINPEMIRYLRSHKINVEILPTDTACTTFNFLNSEGRYVAAALIPPTYVQAYHDDDAELQLAMEKKDLYSLSSDYHEIPGSLKDRHELPPGVTAENIFEKGSKILRDKMSGKKEDEPKTNLGDPKSDQH